MRYNPKAKLDPSQIKDLRTYGGARRVGATGADGAERPVSQEQAAAEADYRRYHHLTYRDAYRPVGHNRGQTVTFSPRKGPRIRGNPTTYARSITIKADKPDGADRVKQPKKKRLKVRRAGPRPARG